MNKKHILLILISAMIASCNHLYVPSWYRTGNSSGFYSFTTPRHVVNQQ